MLGKVQSAVRECEEAPNGRAYAGQQSAGMELHRSASTPTIRAAPDPNDRLGPVAHVDRALSLLDSVPVSAGPAETGWTLHLSDLRDAILTCVAGQP
jgi:hypothetical protein